MRLRRPDVVLVGFAGGTGGISSMLLELARRLQDGGLRVRIVVPSHESARAYVRACRAQGVEAERSPYLLEQRGPLAWRAAAMRLVRRHRAPVMHFHGCENTLDLYYLSALRFWRPRRCFVTLHSPYDTPRAGEREAQRWAAAAAATFDRVIGVSRTGRQRQIDYGIPAHQTSLIYNGVDIERFAHGDAAVARQELGVGPDAQLIVVTARLASQKRPLDAVAAFARVAHEFPAAQLVLVGTGPLEDEIRAAARDQRLETRVHLAGHRRNVEDWLAAATVWFLPTESEGFAVAVPEAMAAGRAVLSTRCPGNDEVLVDGENSLLADVANVDQMAGQLRTLLSNPGLRDRLGSAARRDAARFSLERMTRLHLALYDGRAVADEGTLRGPGHVSVSRGARPRRRLARISRLLTRAARRTFALFIGA